MRIYFRLLLMVSLLFSQNGLDISEMIQNRKVPKDVSNIIKVDTLHSTKSVLASISLLHHNDVKLYILSLSLSSNRLKKLKTKN